MEKPVASDVPGVRRVLAANKIAREQNLMVGIGLQRRHEERYIDCVKRLKDGEIGDINMLRVYWNGSSIWYRDKMPGMSEMAFRCTTGTTSSGLALTRSASSTSTTSMSGAGSKGCNPVEANGMGGREMRLGGDRTKSQIFDHTFC